MATLFVANEKIGAFGELHPIQSKLYGINQSCYLFEFDLHKIETVWLPKQLFDYSTYSVFPSSIVDLSCLVPKNKVFKQVETKIQELGKPLLKSIELFDYYSGDEIPSGYYSLGFKLKFQDQTRTLKNLEIDFLMDQIIKELQSSLQIIFRNKI
jgi:phenylalanyl-tRNA synthetase beta chain